MYCRDYTCLSCIDGSCPKANQEQYNDRGIPVPKDCPDCPYYLGCKGCDWYHTEICSDDYGVDYDL